jgi:DNA-directed RNA polymerase omega subunit
MLTKNIATIEEHHKLIGNRFLLAQIAMKRTTQLIEGAPIKFGLAHEFSKRQNITNQKLAKVALEEIRTGKLPWHTKTQSSTDTDKIIEHHSVVFGE